MCISEFLVELDDMTPNYGAQWALFEVLTAVVDDSKSDAALRRVPPSTQRTAGAFRSVVQVAHAA
jgi:hypothetical protein